MLSNDILRSVRYIFALIIPIWRVSLTLGNVDATPERVQSGCAKRGRGFSVAGYRVVLISSMASFMKNAAR